MSKNKLAVITGASKGIGLAAVNLLLENGYSVAGIGRADVELNHDKYRYYQADVRSLDNMKAVFEQIRQDFNMSIDILVNNAGLGVSDNLVDMDPDDWHLMFDVNVHGLFYCTKLALPDMIEKGEGHIINISSIAGTNGVETMAGYCGTKHAVRGISHSLYKEVRNKGVKVTCIYPGSVNTNFFDEIPGISASTNMMRPEDIAQTIYDCINTHNNYHIVDVEVRPLKPKG